MGLLFEPMPVDTFLYDRIYIRMRRNSERCFLVRTQINFHMKNVLRLNRKIVHSVMGDAVIMLNQTEI